MKEKVTLMINKELMKKFRIKVIERTGKTRNLSKIVEELIKKWIE